MPGIISRSSILLEIMIEKGEKVNKEKRRNGNLLSGIQSLKHVLQTLP